MADIFISYAQEDRQQVKPLVDALTAEGYQVWWDLEIRAGESFDELIESTLEKVQCVVTLWSQHAVASRWVRAESSWAYEHGKFVSIRIDEGIKLPLEFRHVHTRSLVGWKGARDATEYQALRADITKIADSPSLSPDWSPPPEPVPNIREQPISPPRGGQRAKDENLVPNFPEQLISRQLILRSGVARLVVVFVGALAGGIALFGLRDEPIPDDPETPTPSVSSTSKPDKGSFVPLMVFRDTLEDGSKEPEMVVIPGGSFLMGSPNDEPERDGDEGPQHRVTIRSFAISRTEVRFADYDHFAEVTGREKPDDEDRGRGGQPVINVSRDDARAYAEWLSKQTGQGYRLPTEAKWEYAARAGTATPFWTGGCIYTDQANYDGDHDYNGCGAKTGTDRQRAIPAGSLPANTFGLHEVAGNVYEWVEDCWHENYVGAPDDGNAWLEAGGGDCDRGVVRGGSWGDAPRRLRSANRIRKAADAADNEVGIRLARDL